MKKYTAFLRWSFPALFIILSALFWIEIIRAHHKDMSDIYASAYGLKGDGTHRGDEGYNYLVSRYWQEILLLYFIPLVCSAIAYLLFRRYSSRRFFVILQTLVVVAGLALLALYSYKRCSR